VLAKPGDHGDLLGCVFAALIYATLLT